MNKNNSQKRKVESQMKKIADEVVNKRNDDVKSNKSSQERFKNIGTKKTLLYNDEHNSKS
jgi:hypothetical protein